MVATTNAGDVAGGLGGPATDGVDRPAVATRPPGRAASRGSDDAIESPLARLEDLGTGFSERVRARPLTFLALALGVGFAIGGALSFRGGRLALSAATRHLGRELLKQVL